MDTAKIFKNGRSQAVRLPKQYRFSGEKVFIKRMGRGVVLMPEESSWDDLIESTEMFSDDFMVNREQGGMQNRESLFE
ncbi:MAG: antitoxin [Okeania sp. SIO3B3]|nr:antitoxin [Okeania sp. SIO3B3]